jgi:hypothetical protein
VRDAAGGQRQRRDAEEDDEQDREAFLVEQVDQAADRVLARPREPVAQVLRKGVRRC